MTTNSPYIATRPVASTLMAVDLDNTLVRGNTLHIYIKEGLRRAPLTSRLGILSLLMLRRLRLISHVTMKFGCLSRISHSDPELQRAFAEHAKALLSSSVQERIRSFGGRVILATAAADVYIPLIWHGPFLATKTIDNPSRQELRGTLKAEAVVRYALRHDLTLVTVLTDHVDDLPLLSIPGIRPVLVNPTAKTLASLPHISDLEILRDAPNT